MRYMTLPAIVLVTGLLLAAPPKVTEENSGATLIEVGSDHCLADPEPLAAMLKACEAE